jgi:hypothetical protein
MVTHPQASKKIYDIVTGEELRFNGMVNVKVMKIPYRGFTIQNKLDMGSSPWLTHANSIRTGFLVVDSQGCNALPAAGWCPSPLQCRACIDLWIESEFNADKYWELMAPYRW